MIALAGLSTDPVTSSTPNPFTDPSPLNGLPGRRKVCIVGFEEQNQQTAPLDDAEWEVWGLNMGNRLGIMADTHGQFRADRWFDLHEEHAQSAKDMAWINRCPVPIYLTHQFGLNLRARVLDLEAMQRDLSVRYGIAHGGHQLPCDYFASSFAYMVALALSEGFTTIGLFGVSLGWGRERLVERGNLEYWLGLAMGLGVEVVLGPGCRLLTHPGLYGIEYRKEGDGVNAICAETMRQLLQTKEVNHCFDTALRARTEALEVLAKACMRAVQQIVYQEPEHG